jgi:hypothetical protein
MRTFSLADALIDALNRAIRRNVIIKTGYELTGCRSPVEVLLNGRFGCCSKKIHLQSWRFAGLRVLSLNTHFTLLRML